MSFNLPQNTGFPSASSAAPTFNFGNPTTTTAKGFGQPTTGFGLGTSTTGFGTSLGGFGTTPVSSTFGMPSSTFGSTGLGTSAPSTNFGFGTTLGAPTSTGGPSLFGGTLSTSGSFGQAPPAQSSFQGFGGSSTFGAPTGGGGIFGGTGFQQTAGTAQQQPVNQLNMGMTSQQQQPFEHSDFVTANICGDDRDSTITNWNKLQSRWGCGKGFLSAVMPPVPYSQNNIYCCFKAVGYNLLPVNKDEDGLVAISVVTKDSKQAPDPAQMQSMLTQALFPGRPQFSLVMHGIRANLETSHQYVISVSERQPTGQVRCLTATELATNLANARAQLNSLGVENIVPLISPPKEWIQEYLANPPAGIDRKLWDQAIKDNPDPGRLIPTPMVGFADLRSRIRSQEMESSKHLSFLQQAEQKVTELRQSVGEAQVKLGQRRQALLALQQRLLALLVKLQIVRRSGATLLPMEEELKTRLENIKEQMSRPSHCKVKLGEIVSETRLQKAGQSILSTGQYSIDPDAMQDFQKFLALEQEGISRLIDVAMLDQNCLKLITHTMEELRLLNEAGKM